MRQESFEQRLLLAAESERQAVGRDLHDAFGQNLVAMAMLSDELATRLKAQHSQDPDAAEAAERLAALCRDTCGIVREVIRGLTSELSAGTLASALREMASSVSINHAAVCQAKCDRIEVEPEVAEQLYRVAQEAVTNALRHSHCSRILVSLKKRRDDSLILAVEDNGRGIGKSLRSLTGSGLRSMRHRCTMIGAELAVQSHPTGTAIIVRRCSRA